MIDTTIANLIRLIVTSFTAITSPTNGSEMSGMTTVQISAAEGIASVTLLVDGVGFATTNSYTSSLPLPTYLFSNGAHTVAVRVSTEDGAVVTSSPVQVQFQNDITVHWFEAFQSSLPIQANLSFPNANWTVTIQSWNGTLLKELTGSTSSGTIDVTWDGTDGNNNSVPHDALYLITVSAVNQLGGEPPSPAKFASYREDLFSTQQTILACDWHFELEVALSLARIKLYISYADQNPEVYLSAPLIIAPTTTSTTFSWQDFLTILADPRPRSVTQLYYYGHASPMGLGLHPKTGDGVSSRAIGQKLGNDYSYDTTAGAWYADFKTPYKFVFINGCLTANATAGVYDLPGAFGILQNRTDYASTGRKNRAFMGWKIEVYAADPAMAGFVDAFWQDWTYDTSLPLDQAIADAYDEYPNVPINDLGVFGYSGLTWQE